MLGSVRFEKFFLKNSKPPQQTRACSSHAEEQAATPQPLVISQTRTQEYSVVKEQEPGALRQRRSRFKANPKTDTRKSE
jgi:hypothetical protein